MEDFINSRSEFSKIYVDAFIKHFGEERVDVHPNGNFGVDIVVHFPEVKIENERGESIVIYDLFTLIRTSPSGGSLIPGVSAKKSTYTKEQAQSNYIHSHISQIYDREDAKSWKDWCLGSGPITRTFSNIIGLESACNTEQLRLYANLLCMELDNLVKVESLTGGPYIRMETVGNAGEANGTNFGTGLVDEDFFHAKHSLNSYFYRAQALTRDRIDRSRIESNIKSICNAIISKLNFNFKVSNGVIDFAESFTDTAIKISNAFLDECNARNISDNELIKYFYTARLVEGEIKYLEARENDSIYGRVPLGEVCITFKGKPFYFKLTEEETKEDKESDIFFMLDPSIINYFITTILSSVNKNYDEFYKRLNSAKV